MATFSETPTTPTVRTPVLRSTAKQLRAVRGRHTRRPLQHEVARLTPISSTTLPPRSAVHPALSGPIACCSGVTLLVERPPNAGT